MQSWVLILSLVLMALLSSLFIYVAVNAAGREEAFAPIAERAYKWRSVAFWFLLVLGVPITWFSLQYMPYSQTHTAEAGAARAITVDGRQWFWNINSSEAELGEALVFNVTASDVNHGLGIYSPDDQLLAQVQAMPDYVNSLAFTPQQAGTYRLVCMEYCGLAHHAMVSTFEVSRGSLQ